MDETISVEQEIRDHYRARNERWAAAKAELYLGPPPEADAAPMPSPPQQGIMEGAVNKGVQAAGDVVNQVQAGGKQIADAIVPPTQESSILGRGWSALQGLSNVLAPLTDAAGNLASDLIGAMGTVTDEELRAGIERAKLHAPGEVPLYESLLAMTPEERTNTAQGVYRFVAEVAAGFAGLPVGKAMTSVNKGRTGIKALGVLEKAIMKESD